MTRLGLIAGMVVLGICLVLPGRGAALPAFPGAEGFGADAVGGRGGRVVEVTNLNDSGPGSFRAACLATGPRIVVFRVGGTIELKSRIELTAENSYLTIAGQTAPGDGVQSKGWDLCITESCHDVVIRYMKLRPGHTDPEEWSKHGLLVYGSSPEKKCYKIVIDHCSIYWGPDEGVCTWDSVEDVTFQWCLIEGMEHRFADTRYEGSKAALLGTGPGDGSGQGNVTVHHNYMVNCAQRNPLVCADGPFHVVNNVVYNWESFGTAIQNRGSGTKVNLIGNLYVRGPASSTSRYAVGMDGDTVNPDGLIYVRDNIGPYRPDSSYDDWAIMGSGYDLDPTSKYWTIPLEESYRRASPWPDSPVGLTVTPTSELAEAVLRDVGATLPVRDALDQRAIADFRNGTGTIKRAADVRPDWWPTLRGGACPADGDHDGMPDAWEEEHGLDACDEADGAQDADGDGYTNVEEFLNGTNPREAAAGKTPGG